MAERMIMITIGADGRAALVEMDSVTQGAGRMGAGVSQAAASGTRGMRSFHLSITNTELAMLELGGSVGVLYAIAASIDKGTEAANKMDRATMGLAVTSRYVGESIDEVRQAAQALTEDGLMSVTEASQALQNLLSRGFSLPEAIDLMKRFKDSAAYNRQASLEFGASIVWATEGLKNENSILVDNAGVTKNVSVMWKEYAREHGKSLDSLSQAEKRQAEYLGIMRETEGQVGNSARMAATLQGAQAELKQEIFETSAAFGHALQPALLATIGILKPTVSGIRDMIYWVETLGARAAATWDKLKLAADITLSGTGIFSEKGLQEYERRVQSINAQLDGTIMDIVKKADGEGPIDIGADSGKRRQDSKNDDSKEEEKARKAAERKARNARELSMIFAAMRERDLAIGKSADAKELLQLDLKHQQEINRLKNAKASKAQLEEAARLQKRERDNLVADQEYERNQDEARVNAEVAEERLRLQKEEALAAAKIAEGNYQARVQWLEKLDAYQLRTGAINEDTALRQRYDRERGALDLKQKTLAVEIAQEENDSKRNELEAEYARITEEVRQSKELQLQDEEELNQRRLQAAWMHQANLTSIAAAAAEARLQFIGREQGALDLHYAQQRQALAAQYQWELDNLSLSQEQLLAKKREYKERSLQIEQERAQRQADLWWNSSQTYLGYAQQMTTMGLQMLLFDESQRSQIGKRMLATSIRFLAQGLQQYMFSKAKEHLINAASAAGRTGLDVAAGTANLAILEAQAVAWAAYYAAHTLNPFGGQAYIPAATAMAAVAGGVVPSAAAGIATAGAASVAAELGMAAAWGAGGVLVGSLGEAGASAIEGGTSGSTTPAGYGAGSPASPVTTTSPAAAAAPTYIINLHVYGNIVDHDQFAREIYPAIRRAANDGVR